MSIFTMPSLGADMEDGKLVEWLIKPGDQVKRGDVVAVVETQKGAIEIECFETGKVGALLAETGQTLPVGAPLARIGGDDTEVVEAPAPAAPPPATPAITKPVEPPVATPAPSGALRASPAARTLAAERGISLDKITGSGPGGAVLLADVEHFSATPAPAITGIDMTEMRRAIAAAMTRAKREIPHYYLLHEIDLQAAQDHLTALNSDRTPDKRLLMGALLTRATVKAISKVPEMNGRFDAADFEPAAAVNCGLAIALRSGGLIAPAILDAETLTLDATMEAMRDLVARTRNGRLRNSELTQGTITISSLGENGVDALVGVIYPPQVALVGFGTPRLRPVIHDGAIAARMTVSVSLAADHRVSDGRRGAQFLAEIDRNLQEPASL